MKVAPTGGHEEMQEKKKRKGYRKVKPTGGHDELQQDILPSGSEQGSGREDDYIIPDTTLENQSEDDEDTKESICMKIASIIRDIGQTLCENDDCPFKEAIADITDNFSKISHNTALQFSLAATGEHEQAFMERSLKSLTKQAGLNADLDSSSSEEDEESENADRSKFIDDEAVEVVGNEDDYSPDYEAYEEVRNEYSGGQETHEADGIIDSLLDETHNDLENYGFGVGEEWKGE